MAGIIEVNNSFSKLKGFHPNTIKLVQQALTYKDEGIVKEKVGLYLAIKRAAKQKQMRYVAILKQKIADLGPDLICRLSVDNSFPTGVLHIVEKHLNEGYRVVDKRTKPEPYLNLRWNNPPHKLRYYQEEALTIGLEKCRGVFEMSVGSGKTALATYLIKELAVNTIFVVPSTALLDQAYNVFVDAFGSKNVQTIKTADIKKRKKLKPIRVITSQTMASLNKQGLLEVLLNDVDSFIGDEIHHAGSETYVALLPALANVYYRFGLSGTYLRNDSKLLDLWGVAGEKLYEYSAAQATEEGFLTPVEFKIIPLAGKSYFSYQEEYKRNYSSVEFNKALISVVSRIKDDKQILILVDRKEGCGHILYESLTRAGVEVTYVTGDDSKEDITAAIEDFNDKKVRVLLASTILGEGCDIRSTDYLILARGGKSEIAITQAIGRAIRLYPGKETAFVYDFDFEETGFLSRHANIRREIYEKQFAGTITFEGVY